MERKFFQYRILVSDIALTVMVIAVVIFISYWQTSRANNAAARVSNTLEILFHKEILASLASDHETSSRAYLLTGEPQFLQSFFHARANIPKEIVTLQRLTASSSNQRRLADSLAFYFEKRTRFVDSVLAINNNIAQNTVSLLITGPGKIQADHIKRMLARFHLEENNLYTTHAIDSAKALSVQNRIFVGVVALVLLAIIFISFREKKRIRAAELQRSEYLQRSERRFRALVEHNENIIALIDANFNTYYRSPASERITGFTPKDREEMAVGEQNHPDDMRKMEEVMQQIVAHPGKPFPLTLRTKHKNGHWIWLEGYFTNMFHNPDVGAVIVNLRDVTEERQTRERIARINEELEEKVARRTDQLQAANNDMEAFTYSVSHDLRAPLRIINGFTVILEEEYATQMDEEGRRITSIIKKNTAKMGNLIDGLLDFSRLRLQDLSKTAINTNQLVEDLVRSVKEEDGHHIKWVIDELPPMFGDLASLRQVWTNLLSNAVKYSAKREQPRIEIGAFKEEDNTVFFVKDNGVGFDANYKDKLFKVFQRLHSAEDFEGTGIGLAVIHKVIAKHGGKVWAEGEVNKGAAFYFSLPDA